MGRCHLFAVAAASSATAPAELKFDILRAGIPGVLAISPGPLQLGGPARTCWLEPDPGDYPGCAFFVLSGALCLELRFVCSVWLETLGLPVLASRAAAGCVWACLGPY